MTEYEEKFYEKYRIPVLDDYVQGFSGIDPALKTDSSGINHELIQNLLGGDETGHYHLTYEQIQKLNAYIPVKYPPEIDDNQVIHCFANEAVNYTITGINLRME